MENFRKKLEQLADKYGMQIQFVPINDQEELAKEFYDVLVDAVKDVAETYTLVEWSYSQAYMDEEWYQEEAIPSPDGSVFIPTKFVYDLGTLN